MNYRLFTEINPSEYPECKNHQIEYRPDEPVSPVVIIDSEGNKYRTHMIHWFLLTDIHDGIILKQSLVRRKILPFAVFIDENKSIPLAGKWIVEIMNLVGIQIISKLKPRV